MHTTIIAALLGTALVTAAPNAPAGYYPPSTRQYFRPGKNFERFVSGALAMDMA